MHHLELDDDDEEFEERTSIDNDKSEDYSGWNKDDLIDDNKDTGEE